MTKQEAAGFFGGAAITFTKWLSGWAGNEYLETAIKGLIGGVLGYCGQQTAVWIYRRIKNAIKK